MGSSGVTMTAGSLAASQPATANRAGASWRPWQALRRNRRAVIGLLLILLVVVLAALAPVIGRYDPTYGDFENILAAPTVAHPAGTDGFGRDVLVRVLYGYRVSMVVAFASVSAAVLIGIPLGLLAGYFGGLTDNLIMRPLDLLMAFPAILLAVSLIAILGKGTAVVALALAIIYLPIMARVLRGSVISARGEEYVEAAQSIGATPLRVMARHIIPNSTGPLVVQVSISMGIAILIEASLSFIGLGTQPPEPSLGSMLAEGRDFMREAPWVVVFPGLAIMLAVLSFNLLGDGLHDLISGERR
jgi:peptide/nickel transport system permease protein